MHCRLCINCYKAGLWEAPPIPPIHKHTLIGRTIYAKTTEYWTSGLSMGPTRLQMVLRVVEVREMVW